LPSALARALFGDDQATAAANRFLSSNRKLNKDAFFLKTLALQGMKVGIKACGTQPFEAERACGDNVYFKTIRSKA
jgi:hypothetical protein